MATQVDTHACEEATQSTPPIKAARFIVSQAASRRNAKGQHEKLIGRHDVRVAFCHAKGSGNVVRIPAKGLERPGVGWRALKAMCGAR